MSNGNLVSLGFFKDECSDTQQLYATQKRQELLLQSEVEYFPAVGEGESAQSQTAGVLLSVVMFLIGIIIGFCAAFFCLKRKLKRSSSSRVPDIDATPQRHAPVAESSVVDFSRRGRNTAIDVSDRQI